MTQEHPIAPPPELVQQWWDDFNGAFYEFEAITAKVFQYGADQELEACCEWLEQQTLCGHQDLLPSFRTSRRPKPPSLKEQALQALSEAVKMADDVPPEGICSGQADTIRRALEQLDD
jgi:hypothetical protein